MHVRSKDYLNGAGWGVGMEFLECLKHEIGVRSCVLFLSRAYGLLSVVLLDNNDVSLDTTQRLGLARGG